MAVQIRPGAFLALWTFQRQRDWSWHSSVSESMVRPDLTVAEWSCISGCMHCAAAQPWEGLLPEGLLPRCAVDCRVMFGALVHVWRLAFLRFEFPTHKSLAAIPQRIHRISSELRS